MDILVVDDEPLARERLIRMLGKLDGYRVVAEADDADSALNAISSEDPDLVLLDVRMPGDDGLTLAHRIAELDDPPAIIFCTAYDQYALEAFGTQAVGYLLKPVKTEQLQDVLARAQRLNKLQRVATRRPIQDSGTRTHISARTRRGVDLIPLEDIRFFCG